MGTGKGHILMLAPSPKRVLATGEAASNAKSWKPLGIGPQRLEGLCSA